MPKYLVRRRNQWGQWVHLATYDYEPSDYDLKFSFGPGEYVVLMAQEGIIGLSKVRDVNVPWEIKYLGEVEGEPTIAYVREKYGTGNYFILKSCKPIPVQVYPEGQPHDVTWQNLQDGASVMKKISIIYKVEMPWV